MMQSLILSNFVKAMQKLLGFRKAFIMPYKSLVYQSWFFLLYLRSRMGFLYERLTK